MTRTRKLLLSTLLLTACEGAIPGADRDASARDSTVTDAPAVDAYTRPPVVTPCPDSAGGGSVVGEWVDVTPQYVRDHPTYTGTLVPIVDPSNPSTVYVTTDSNGIFKSTDCGANWTRVNVGTNGDQLNSGRIWVAVIDRRDTSTLFALTGYGAPGLWKSVNAGVDWMQMFDEQTLSDTGGFTEMVSIDPDDSMHLIANFHQGTACRSSPVCIAETRNGGATWRLVDVPASLVPATYEGSGVAILSGDVWLHTGFLRTADGGATWVQATLDPPLPGNAWAQIVGNGSIFRTPDGTYYLGSSVGVYMSNSAELGAEWTLIPNSGISLTPVLGDGESLYAVGAPGGTTSIWTATYADPMTWTQLDTPGLPTTTVSGGGPWTLDADQAHHLLYLTLGHGGLWRMRTQ